MPHKNKKLLKIYTCWYGMMRRCYNKKSKRYKDWGGRGIKVCQEWHIYSAFKHWALANMPPGRSIDRINNNGPYSPKNCKWATPKEQASNRRIDTPGCIRRTKARVAAATKAQHAKFGNPKTRVKKACSRCKKLQVLNNFVPNTGYFDGYSCYCRPCVHEYQNKWKKNWRDARNK